MTRRCAAAFRASLFLVVSSSAVFAETDAQWRPKPQNRPPTCGALWRGISLPQDANTASRDTTFVCHKRFFLSHDNTTKTPDWVIERLKKSQLPIDGADRPEGKAFVQEKLVPPRGRAKPGDYTNTKTGLDRGHMAPSEDFNNRLADMKDSFVYSNAVPQAGDRFNGSIWARLEDEVRKIARRDGDIYVTTGPVRRVGDSNTRTIAAIDNSCGKRIDLQGPNANEKFVCASLNHKPDFCPKGVAVPIGIYKIVYIRSTRTAFAFLMPNRDHDVEGDALDYLDSFRVSVAAIEGVTAIKFFREIDGGFETIVRDCAPGRPWAP